MEVSELEFTDLKFSNSTDSRGGKGKTSIGPDFRVEVSDCLGAVNTALAPLPRGSRASNGNGVEF